MNNNHFAVARYLRDAGVDAHVLLMDNEYPHFHPSADCYGELPGFVHQLTWGSARSLIRTSIDQVKKDIAPFDLLVGCGYAPAHCLRARRSLDVFAPYGSDIWEATQFRLCRPKNIPVIWNAVWRQRWAIGSCRVVHMAPCKSYENNILRFAPHAIRWREGLPMVYAPMYLTPDPMLVVERSCYGSNFKKVRDESDLMIFSSVRHAWKLPGNDPSLKGTDRLLQAIAILKKQRPSLRVKLVTFEYGNDVSASRERAKELGISNCICWFPKMSRKDLMAGLLLSDAACGEFYWSYDSSGVILEALVVGKPIVMHRNDEDYVATAPPGGLCPVRNAKTPEEIAGQLEWIASNRKSAADFGARGREWYNTQIVRPALNRYLALVQGKSLERYEDL